MQKMYLKLELLLLIYYVIPSHSVGSINWVCRQPENQCRRIIGPEIHNNISMPVCRLTCGEGGTLWPYPSEAFKISKDLIPIDIMQRSFNVEFKYHSSYDSMAYKSFTKHYEELFEQLFKGAPAFYFSNNKEPSLYKNKQAIPVRVKVIVDLNKERLSYDTYEGYVLSKDNDSPDIIIISDNNFGARHAIITLLQLIIYDPLTQLYLMPSSFHIPDRPAYSHRGVMLDTAHNFMTVDAIKRLLLGLSLSKINTIHWHITDSSSFPLITLKNSKLARYGAYAANKVYSTLDILSIMEYANMVGIRLIPEVPIPAPMGSGWQWGSNANIGDLVVCYNQPPYNNKCKNPPCGQLNIVNPNAVELVKSLYSEIIALFGKSIYHLGGSGVDISCWSGINTEEGNRLWANLLNDIADMIIARGGEVIIFSNDLLNDTTEWLSPNKFIVQVTEEENIAWIQELITRGYRLILSPEDRARWDCGYGQYSQYQVTGNCNRPLGWHASYDITAQNRVIGSNKILGGEGMLYSYFSGSYNTDERMLLKAAGLAERFWSNPTNNYLGGFTRIGYYSWWLKSIGFNVESVEPYWCTQNTGKCLLGE
ncbi:hypothetical protein GJ496_007052 [Pomphorhynchus laevis]|nr:hypothetical protein GJ496_007052 [Pomphorhynchus laevis]